MNRRDWLKLLPAVVLAPLAGRGAPAAEPVRVRRSKPYMEEGSIDPALAGRFDCPNCLKAVFEADMIIDRFDPPQWELVYSPCGCRQSLEIIGEQVG